MFSFFKKKSPDTATAHAASPAISGTLTSLSSTHPETASGIARHQWLAKLKTGLSRTGASIASAFTGARIDDALYEELESALLMADTGVAATQHLLGELKLRVKATGSTEPQQVRALLAHTICTLLTPLQRPLVISHSPTVIMVVGVNGAGKTTSIGKLTRHLNDAGASVLLAAADTFRAAAREQLAAWATRAGSGTETPARVVEIISHEGADPAAVAFDAVSAGIARSKNVVLIDTAGRLTTQLHLMEELKKIKRVIQKAKPASDTGLLHEAAPHEVLLVIDGNTGQNALAQVKAFHEALQLTGLVITKLDGTAKGGVLCAIALWAREVAVSQPEIPPIAVYFIGVGEQLQDLETFHAEEFAQALIA